MPNGTYTKWSLQRRIAGILVKESVVDVCTIMPKEDTSVVVPGILNVTEDNVYLFQGGIRRRVRMQVSRVPFLKIHIRRRFSRVPPW